MPLLKKSTKRKNVKRRKSGKRKSGKRKSVKGGKSIKNDSDFVKGESFFMYTPQSESKKYYEVDCIGHDGKPDKCLVIVGGTISTEKSAKAEQIKLRASPRRHRGPRRKGDESPIRGEVGTLRASPHRRQRDDKFPRRSMKTEEVVSDETYELIGRRLMELGNESLLKKILEKRYEK